MFASCDLLGQSETQLSAGGLFLLLPVGARAVATGQAAVADGGSSEAAFWNPAGLAIIEHSEFALHHYQIFAGTGNALAVYRPAGGVGVIGFIFYQLDFGEIDVTGSGGSDPLGRISARNLEFLGSYATTLPGLFSLGVNFKVIQVRTDCSGFCAGVPDATGTTQAVDLGIQRVVANGRLRLGVALQNLGLKLQLQNKAQADPLPTRIRVGVVYTARLDPRPQSPNPLDLRVLADVSDDLSAYGNPDARVGVDVGLGEIFRVRAGYAFTREESRGIAVGVGVRAGNVAFDLARELFDEFEEQEPTQISVRLIF